MVFRRASGGLPSGRHGSPAVVDEDDAVLLYPDRPARVRADVVLHGHPAGALLDPRAGRRVLQKGSGRRSGRPGFGTAWLGGVQRREHPRSAAHPGPRSRARDLGREPRALRLGDRGVPRVGTRRAGGARPHARDGALHRHRRLDRARPRELGDRAWRELLERHDAGPAARARALPRPRGRAPPATASSPPSTARRGRSTCAQRDLRRGARHSGSRCGPAATPARSSCIGDDVGGIAVHIGARVGALAAPSEVLVVAHRQGPRRRLRHSSSRTAASTRSRASRRRWRLYAALPAEEG